MFVRQAIRYIEKETKTGLLANCLSCSLPFLFDCKMGKVGIAKSSMKQCRISHIQGKGTLFCRENITYACAK